MADVDLLMCLDEKCDTCLRVAFALEMSGYIVHPVRCLEDGTLPNRASQAVNESVSWGDMTRVLRELTGRYVIRVDDLPFPPQAMRFVDVGAEC